jgi:hypothetical protein
MKPLPLSSAAISARRPRSLRTSYVLTMQQGPVGVMLWKNKSSDHCEAALAAMSVDVENPFARPATMIRSLHSRGDGLAADAGAQLDISRDSDGFDVLQPEVVVIAPIEEAFYRARTPSGCCGCGWSR